MSAFQQRHAWLLAETTGPAIAHCLERGRPEDVIRTAELAEEGVRAVRALGLYGEEIATRDDATAKAPAATKPAELPRSVNSGRFVEAGA